jgi:cytochrome c oxidase subunit 4
MNAPPLSPKNYVVIWAALMFLLFLTWGVAQINLGAFNTVVALIIAVMKMLLVILFFMHVRYSPRLTWIFVSAGFIWLLIMIDLTLSDYLTRGLIRDPFPQAQKLQKQQAPWIDAPKEGVQEEPQVGK